MHKVGRILECPLELISTHTCRKCILRMAFTGTPLPLSPHLPPAWPTHLPPPPCLSSLAPPHHPPSWLAWGWHPDQLRLPRRDREVQGGRFLRLPSVQQVIRRPGVHARYWRDIGEILARYWRDTARYWRDTGEILARNGEILRILRDTARNWRHTGEKLARYCKILARYWRDIGEILARN